jgi:hypothetical protein
MRLGRVVVAVATMWFSTTTLFAQFIVIRTGQNVDGVLSTPLVDGKLIFEQQCLTEWAGNFQMVNFCEEQQLKALKSLGRE